MRPTSQTTQGELTIRPFRSEDQALTKRLVLAGLAEHWGTLDPTLNPDLDDIASTYSDATFLVACHGHDLIGTGALVHERDGVARIVRMSVAPQVRRRGVGTLMLRHLCERAQAAGYRHIVLETTSTWEDAIAFYTRHGFRVVGAHAGDTHFVLDLPPPARSGRGEEVKPP